MDPQLLERITARRAELDELEEQLAKQLAEARVERDELAVAGRVLERVSEQLADERASAALAPGQVGGRAVMPIPHRTSGVEEAALPSHYQRILAAVRQGAGPVMARQVGEVLGVDVSERAKLEPLRGKLVRLSIGAGCANYPMSSSLLVCRKGRSVWAGPLLPVRGFCPPVSASSAPCRLPRSP